MKRTYLFSICAATRFALIGSASIGKCPLIGILLPFFVLLGSQPGSAQVDTEIKFLSFKFAELKGRPAHEGLFPIDGAPLLDNAHLGTARLNSSVSSAQFRLVRGTGDAIKDIDLVLGGHIAATTSEFVGLIDVPDEEFRVAVSGTDVEGNPFEATFPTLFQAQPISVHFDLKTFDLRPGTTLISGFATNFGLPDTFQLLANGSTFVTGIEPANLTLNTDETGLFDVEITIPSETPKLTLVPVSVSATSTTEANVTNRTAVTLLVAPLDGEIFEIEIRRVVAFDAPDGMATISGVINLSENSDGIDPVTEPVTVTLGAHSDRIPAGLIIKRGETFHLRQLFFPGIKRISFGPQGMFNMVLNDTDFSEVNFDRPVRFGLRIGDDVGEVMLKRDAEYPFVVISR